MNKSALAFQVVLTKLDKIKDHERDQVLEQVRSKLAKHPAAFPELILTSSEKGEGLATLRAVIAGLE
jgi:GTP-binding protein